MVTQRIKNRQLMVMEYCVFEFSPNKINPVRETCNHVDVTCFSKGLAMAPQILSEKFRTGHLLNHLTVCIQFVLVYCKSHMNVF